MIRTNVAMISDFGCIPIPYARVMDEIMYNRRGSDARWEARSLDIRWDLKLHRHHFMDAGFPHASHLRMDGVDCFKYRQKK